MAFFQKLYVTRLQEKFQEITADLADESYIKYGFEDEDEPNSIVRELTKIDFKRDWAYIGVNYHGTGDAREAIIRIFDFCNQSWISLDKEDKPIGVFGIKTIYYRNLPNELKRFFYHRTKFLVEEHERCVEEIAMLSFKENNITFTKDVLNKIIQLKEEYPLIAWSVDKNIPAYKLYEKWVPKNNGYQWKENNLYAEYVISKHFGNNGGI